MIQANGTASVFTKLSINQAEWESYLRGAAWQLRMNVGFHFDTNPIQSGIQWFPFQKRVHGQHGRYVRQFEKGKILSKWRFGGRLEQGEPDQKGDSCGGAPPSGPTQPLLGCNCAAILRQTRGLGTTPQTCGNAPKGPVGRRSRIRSQTASLGGC